MRRMRTTYLQLGCLLTFLFTGWSSKGLIVHVDGFLDLSLVVCDRDAVVCNFSTREGGHELFALDPRTGRKLWSFQGSARTAAAAVEAGRLFHVTGDVLFNRNLTNGAVLWKTVLNTIPAQKPNLPFSITRSAKEALGNVLPSFFPKPALPMLSGLNSSKAPTGFGYRGPFFTGGKLLLARTGYAGGGCVIETCFEDWLLLDPKAGRFVEGGAGRFEAEFAGSARFQTRDIINGGYITFAIEDGTKCQTQPIRTVTGEILELSEFFSPFDAPAKKASPQALVRYRDRALFFWDQAKVIPVWSKVIEARSDGRWHALPNHVLNYRTRTPYYASKEEERIVPEIHVFDLGGRQVSNLNVEPPSPDSKIAPWGIEWIGMHTDDSMAFQRWSAVDFKETRTISEEDVLLLDAPMLKPRGAIKLSGRPFADGTQLRRTLHMMAGCPYVFVLTGDVTLYKMTAPAVPTEFRVEAVDLRSGYLVWQHREKVTIRKSSGG